MNSQPAQINDMPVLYKTGLKTFKPGYLKKAAAIKSVVNNKSICSFLNSGSCLKKAGMKLSTDFNIVERALHWLEKEDSHLEMLVGLGFCTATIIYLFINFIYY
ncbi:hypothetical protein Dtox_4312 [Desulfofarcimen acetoxidans DSM 771]|uniref:Uncharacterized protein n=1 Tax=Desulfofarcimen acetoxidans (strain ATCC 49208 / DSM 771 / KCTC 5769 / VKM B-1644 / 5575) TaxID=485916 RepID=C8W008_DESAS|nr:hypothetical protein [Desulfofarcimen acetoxidans]ACV64976.1 hypothetical protein Dtox_4312 [Desulfofarcimen acetoxidans DSM 771]